MKEFSTFVGFEDFSQDEIIKGLILFCPGLPKGLGLRAFTFHFYTICSGLSSLVVNHIGTISVSGLSYLGDTRSGYTKTSGQICTYPSILRSFLNKFDLPFSKFLHWFTSRSPPFTTHISHVISMSPDKQMTGINTGTNITLVTHK